MSCTASLTRWAQSPAFGSLLYWLRFIFVGSVGCTDLPDSNWEMFEAALTAYNGKGEELTGEGWRDCLTSWGLDWG